MKFIRRNGAKARRTAAGFTLIELLVVIAIIAILAAMLLPVLARSKMQGVSVNCMSNLKQLQLAWNSYASDNKGKLVGNNFNGPNLSPPIPCWAYGEVNSGDQLNITNIMIGALYPYVQNVKIYQCPSETTLIKIGNQSGYLVRNYSMNGQMNGMISLDNYGPWNVSESDIQHPPPARAMVFIHESDITIDDTYFAIDAVTRIWQNYPAIVHLNGDNLSFADGHAEHWTWLERNTLKLSGAGGYDPALSPVDKDFDRVAGAYSTALKGGGAY